MKFNRRGLRASAYIRGPKIGPVRTNLRLGSVGVAKSKPRKPPVARSQQPPVAHAHTETREDATAEAIRKMKPECEKLARQVATYATFEDRVRFRRGFEKDPENAATLRTCGWYWDVDGFLRHN